MSRKSRSTLNAVEKLIEQRRLFQDWLTKLDGNTEGMPAHVIERVRNDYRARLEAVITELAEHQDALREALTEAEERQQTVERHQQAKRDELAELRLRRQVGEMDDARFKEQSASLKAMIDGLTKELGAAIRDGERYEEILETIVRAQVGDVAEESEPEYTAPAPRARAPEPEEEEVEEEEPEVRIPVAEEKAKPAAAGKGVGDELAFLRSVTTQPPVKLPTVKIEKVQLPPAPPPETEARQVEQSASRVSAEMQAPVLEEDEAAEELIAAPHMVQMPAEEEPAPPPAAQPGGKVKALVCGECGAVNRPTEWYCEKCGAELSAL